MCVAVIYKIRGIIQEVYTQLCKIQVSHEHGRWVMRACGGDGVDRKNSGFHLIPRQPKGQQAEAGPSPDVHACQSTIAHLSPDHVRVIQNRRRDVPSGCVYQLTTWREKHTVISPRGE